MPFNYSHLSIMHFISADKVCQLMNIYGADHTPFLFAVNYELTEGFVIANPTEATDIMWKIEREGNDLISNSNGNGSFFCPKPIEYKTYAEKFAVAHEGLMRGDSFLLNLTVQTPIDTDYSLEEIYFRSSARYKLLVPDHFVCFSPETFVTITDCKISSFPMKGTISAAVPDAANVILNDYKESAEHNTIVDLIRNDLNRIASNVRVERFRYIDSLKTDKGEILQVFSQITGELASSYNEKLGDIIFDMLPAGSISGAPKPSTINIIKSAEGQERGYYSGVFGYYDGKNFKSAVMIRFVENIDGITYFRSGGGVTVNSSCEDEYAEVLQKIYLPFAR